MSSEAYIGVDVSKDLLDVKVLPSNEVQQFFNDDPGVKKFITFVIKIDPQLIVFESTGGLEMLAVSSLIEKHLPAVVINPRQIRDFAKATGRLAKTDSIDADVCRQVERSLK